MPIANGLGKQRGQKDGWAKKMLGCVLFASIRGHYQFAVAGSPLPGDNGSGMGMMEIVKSAGGCLCFVSDRL